MLAVVFGIAFKERDFLLLFIASIILLSFNFFEIYIKNSLLSFHINRNYMCNFIVINWRQIVCDSNKLFKP